MMRFDYRQSRFERMLGRRRPEIHFQRPLHRSLIALGFAALAFAFTATFETTRLGRLDAELATLHDRLAGAATANARLEAAQRRFTRLARLRAIIVADRRAADATMNTIAAFGNALPPRTWLTRVQAPRTGVWSIAGRSERLAEIGTTMTMLANLDRSQAVRLISVSAAAAHDRLLDFTLATEPKP